jgi:hypothetical protein
MEHQAQELERSRVEYGKVLPEILVHTITDHPAHRQHCMAVGGSDGASEHIEQTIAKVCARYRCHLNVILSMLGYRDSVVIRPASAVEEYIRW